MKKSRLSPIIFAVAVLLLLTISVLGIVNGNNSTASADYNMYGTSLSRYDIVYDIKSNRKISITENITVDYKGNTGFLRDIPINGGELVKNLRVSEITNGIEQKVAYDIITSEDSRFISADIGDYSSKYGERTYRITYDYCLTKAQEGNNLLALTPVGGGWQCYIHNVTVKFILPDGYIPGSADCFIQDYPALCDVITEETTENGKTVVSCSAEIIAGGHGQSLRADFSFEDGALTTYFDLTPYIAIIISAIFLGIVIALKFLRFNKRAIIPIVNFEAPDGMNPLLMGKLIDNNIGNEDITSMLYYWADKGYLKINLDDADDPSLIRMVKHLPDNAPHYEKIMFKELFGKYDAIKPSSLKYRFYHTVDKVKSSVNAQTKGLYDKKTSACSGLFAAAAVLIAALSPFFIALIQISPLLFNLFPLAIAIPAVFIYMFGRAIQHYSLKMKKIIKILCFIGVAALCAVFGLLFTVFISDAIIKFLPSFLLGTISLVTVFVSVFITERTQTYTEQLNGIIGFREFIKLAEKDKLETLLADDPQFYYHVLPYAQVLGVSDIWENKFADITLAPPQWAVSSYSVLDFYIINSAIRRSMNTVSRNMVSRPSSSGSSGGGHGSFGGHGGGGHGGGGGRFR